MVAVRETGALAAGPRDGPSEAVARVGVEPTGTGPSTRPLCRFAYRAVGSPRPRCRSGRSVLMRDGRAPAAPGLHTRSAPPAGLEPAASAVTGRRALRCSARACARPTPGRDGSGGIRTLSISRSEREWSACCLPSRFEFRGLESNQRLQVQSLAPRPAATAPESRRGRPSIRGGGFEPPSPDSKSGGLPLADPPERPAGVEPACPAWGAGA